MSAPPSETDITALKADLRRQVLEKRAAMGHCGRAEANLAAAQKALLLLQRVEGTVGLFCAIRDEIDPAPLAGALRLRGIPLALPAVTVRDAPLVFRRWDKDDRLAPDPLFRIPTPRAEAAQVRPAVVLVPLAAFDRAGRRIGYGGGFYDRTLAVLRAEGPVMAIGYAFACQEVAQVPAAPHDAALDMVITQDGIIHCTAAP